MGIALGRHLLCADLLRSERLIRVGEEIPAFSPKYRYYCVTATEPGSQLKQLTAWIRRQIAETTAL